jgi:6-phosphogluconolactonase (cycloisomerase 2 family)
MRALAHLATVTGAGLVAAALFAAPAQAAGPARSTGPVFVQNDALSGNTVVAYDRTPSGGLVQVGKYPTGGRGGQLSGSVVDHLASEGSLAYDRSAHLLYAVNAGSNTVTTFAVDGDRLVRRQVLPTFGNFPVSVATHGNLVYVLNARNGGSVQGYVQVGGFVVPIPGWHRALHLATSAPGRPDEFTSTPAQIGFAPDGRSVVVATKNGGNSLLTFAVGAAGPSARPVVTALPGTVPFGFDVDTHGTLLVTQAGPNAVASFRFGHDGRLSALDSGATGQAATCWVVVAGDVAYASNAGSGSISSFRVGVDGSLTPLHTTATDPGTVDAAVSADGRQLFVQTGKNGTVDAFRINSDGSLTPSGSVTVPGAVGAEGIVAL